MSRRWSKKRKKDRERFGRKRTGKREKLTKSRRI